MSKAVVAARMIGPSLCDSDELLAEAATELRRRMLARQASEPLQIVGAVDETMTVGGGTAATTIAAGGRRPRTRAAHIQGCRGCVISIRQRTTLIRVTECSDCVIHVEAAPLTGRLDVSECEHLRLELHAPSSTIVADRLRDCVVLAADPTMLGRVVSQRSSGLSVVIGMSPGTEHVAIPPSGDTQVVTHWDEAAGEVMTEEGFFEGNGYLVTPREREEMRAFFERARPMVEGVVTASVHSVAQERAARREGQR